MRPRLLLTASPVAVGVCLALSGCAAFPVLRTATSLGHSQPPATPDPFIAPDVVAPRVGQADLIPIPGVKASTILAPEAEATPAQIAQLVGDGGPVSVSLPPQSLPQFLDTAFGEVLKVPYSLGPNIGSRQDIITLRSGPDMPRAQFFTLLKTALGDYGVRLFIRNGAVVVQDDTSPTSGVASLLRSRSAKDTPEGSRTVVQFFQMQTLEANSVQQLIQDLFPAGRAVTVRPELISNTLILSGSGRDVQGVVSFLQELDRPAFSGASVVRAQPVFWGTDAFARALEDVLSAEGYKISRQTYSPRAILILAQPAIGQVLVFANDPDLVDRINSWIRDLDRPSALGDKRSTFVYDVRNTNATDLGAMATGVGTGTTSLAQPPAGVAGGATASAQAASQGAIISGGAVPGGGSILVDKLSNRILFTGTATQYAVLRELLEQLDKAPPQVMIEVTVAEVTLTDATRVGLEWFFTQSGSNGTYSGGTMGKLGIGGAGLSVGYTGTDLRAAFNAFASNNKVNIVSRPQLTAKSGEDARIQVGTDIPIITSQSASNVQTSGATNVLQTVQYRQTGVILKIRPTVYGNNRVDLEISQEISKQSSSNNAAIASPSILNRSLSTKISILDGATHVMGGLIDDNFGKANTGIPFLKDIPIIGNAFRTDTVDGTKTELVLLVTPFILHDADDMALLSSQMTGEVNRAFRVGRGGSYTLTGISTGHNLGLALPPAKTLIAGTGRKDLSAKKKGQKTNGASPDVRR